MIAILFLIGMMAMIVVITIIALTTVVSLSCKNLSKQTLNDVKRSLLILDGFLLGLHAAMEICIIIVIIGHVD